MWRRKWQSTPVFLPGESQGRGSLVGCRLWGHTGWTWLKWPDAMIFVFRMLSFKPTFSLSTFTFIKRLFSYSSLSALRLYAPQIQVHVRVGLWPIFCGIIFSFPSSSCSAQFQVALSSLLWLWCRRACLILLNSHGCYCNLRLKAIGTAFQNCPPYWTWPLFFLPLRANNLGQRGVLLSSLWASAVLIPHSHHHLFQILFKNSLLFKKKKKTWQKNVEQWQLDFTKG